MEEKARIVQWIDKILEDSIQASPHTTPCKKSNKTIRAYQTYLKQQYQFGSAANDFDLVEGENDRGHEIIYREGYVVARYAEEIGDSDDETEYSEIEEVGHSEIEEVDHSESGRGGD